MTTYEKLILTYEPNDPKNNICVTDLTDSSTNCIEKLLTQKKLVMLEPLIQMRQEFW